MTPERWREIERLYHAALERDAGERAAFLADACEDDAALRREVESLLGVSNQERRTSSRRRRQTRTRHSPRLSRVTAAGSRRRPRQAGSSVASSASTKSRP